RTARESALRSELPLTADALAERARQFEKIAEEPLALAVGEAVRAEGVQPCQDAAARENDEVIPSPTEVEAHGYDSQGRPQRHGDAARRTVPGRRSHTRGRPGGRGPGRPHRPGAGGALAGRTDRGPRPRVAAGGTRPVA